MNINYKPIIGFLILIILTLWLAILSTKNDLQIIACDVGQGDAILITQNSSQILIDGGPNNNVIDCLSDHMPFWDNQIEIVILTHPQADHYKGLIKVFEEYRVNYYLFSSLNSSNQSYKVLSNLAQNKAKNIINPNKGLTIRLGLIYLDILWPSEQFLVQNNINYTQNVLGTSTTKKDPNIFSTVVELKYFSFSAIFTGDIGPDIADILTDNILSSHVTLLKIPHHGSKNGLSEKLLIKLNPKLAIISVGKNQWGHPHKEVLDLLNKYKVNTLRTDQLGDIVISTNGNNYKIK